MRELITNTELNPGDSIDTAETAAILGVKPGTLEIWRHQGKGPEYIKLGRAVRYYRPQLVAYVNEMLRVSTTA